MVENLSYPREVGSPDIAEPSALLEEAPFGHCPACGSVGMEDGPSFESDTMWFSCSDFECRTYYYETRPTLDPARPLRGKGSQRTTWTEAKTPEIKAMEENLQSWNLTHFSLEFCQEHDLV